jgi:hypothetical protein
MARRVLQLAGGAVKNRRHDGDTPNRGKTRQALRLDPQIIPYANPPVLYRPAKGVSRLAETNILTEQERLRSNALDDALQVAEPAPRPRHTAMQNRRNTPHNLIEDLLAPVRQDHWLAKGATLRQAPQPSAQEGGT